MFEHIRQRLARLRRKEKVAEIAVDAAGEDVALAAVWPLELLAAFGGILLLPFRKLFAGLERSRGPRLETVRFEVNGHRVILVPIASRERTPYLEVVGVKPLPELAAAFADKTNGQFELLLRPLEETPVLIRCRIPLVYNMSLVRSLAEVMSRVLDGRREWQV